MATSGNGKVDKDSSCVPSNSTGDAKGSGKLPVVQSVSGFSLVQALVFMKLSASSTQPTEVWTSVEEREGVVKARRPETH